MPPAGRPTPLGTGSGARSLLLVALHFFHLASTAGMRSRSERLGRSSGLGRSSKAASPRSSLLYYEGRALGLLLMMERKIAGMFDPSKGLRSCASS